jgi:hypothetical protein
MHACECTRREVERPADLRRQARQDVVAVLLEQREEGQGVVVLQHVLRSIAYMCICMCMWICGYVDMDVSAVAVAVASNRALLLLAQAGKRASVRKPGR